MAGESMARNASAARGFPRCMRVSSDDGEAIFVDYPPKRQPIFVAEGLP
jgi:transposase